MLSLRTVRRLAVTPPPARRHHRCYLGFSQILSREDCKIGAPERCSKTCMRLCSEGLRQNVAVSPWIESWPTARLAPGVVACRPVGALDVNLIDAELSTMLRLQLGVDVYDEEAPCTFCEAVNDRRGIHARSCACGGDQDVRQCMPGCDVCLL